MNAADVAEGMAQAGCSAEQIASALRFLKNKPSSAAARQKRYRDRNALRNVTSRDVTPLPPPPTKEKVAPKENTPTPPSPLFTADAVNVDVPVDGPSAVEKSKKNLDQLRDFGGSWNQLAGELRLPMIDEIKPGSPRERQALARLREMPETGIGGLMARIRGSPFLCGSSGFVASFDWVIKPSNFQKIMEGNYEDRKVTEISKWRR